MAGSVWCLTPCSTGPTGWQIRPPMTAKLLTDLIPSEGDGCRVRAGTGKITSAHVHAEAHP